MYGKQHTTARYKHRRYTTIYFGLNTEEKPKKRTKKKKSDELKIFLFLN